MHLKWREAGKENPVTQSCSSEQLSYDALNFKYQPVKFFSLAFLITWGAWLTAAYLSFHENLTPFKYVFVFVGLLSPFIAAMVLIYGSGQDELKRDFRSRLTDLKRIQPKYLLVILLTMPVTVVLATLISLLVGQSVDQFALSPAFSMTGWNIVVMMISAVLAPTLEELGWRGYGVDSLHRRGRSLFEATLLFGLIWSLWHVPLFFIKGYFHYEMLHTNLIYALNFFPSVFTAAFLGNWIYYRNNRSILTNILFHASLNVSISLFQTAQLTKCIINAILLVISVIVFLAFKPWWIRSSQGEERSAVTP